MRRNNPHGEPETNPRRQLILTNGYKDRHGAYELVIYIEDDGSIGLDDQIRRALRFTDREADEVIADNPNSNLQKAILLPHNRVQILRREK